MVVGATKSGSGTAFSVKGIWPQADSSHMIRYSTRTVNRRNHQYCIDQSTRALGTFDESYGYVR